MMRHKLNKHMMKFGRGKKKCKQPYNNLNDDDCWLENQSPKHCSFFFSTYIFIVFDFKLKQNNFNAF